MTTTVAEKLVAAYGRLLPPDRAWLEAQGVPPLAIHMYPGPIGITPEPSPMFIRPVYAEAAYSDIVGAVAWPQRDPSQFVMAAGAAIGLGQHFLTDAADPVEQDMTGITVDLFFAEAHGFGRFRALAQAIEHGG